MRNDTIELRVKKLEAEVRELRREIGFRKKRQSPGKGPRSFSELKGFLKGKIHLTDEEIDATKISVKDLPE